MFTKFSIERLIIKSVLFIALAMLLAGCSYTRTVQPYKPSEFSKLSIPQDEKVQITLADGRELTVVNLQVKPDSACWYNPSSSKIECLATHQLTGITRTNHTRGAIEGLALGLAGGALIAGLGSTLAMGELIQSNGGEAMGTLATTTTLATATIIAGSANGAAAGSKTYYHIQSIKPLITVKKSTRSGAANHEIIVIFEDNQGKRLELKDARVSINDIPVELRKKGDANSLFYTIKEYGLQIVADSTYTIKIAFSGGKEYSAYVRTREKDLSLPDVPAIHHRTEPLTLRWTGADSRHPVRIRTIRTVEVKGKQKMYPAEFAIMDPAASEYTFPADFFTEYAGLSRVEFTVISTTEGQMDKEFAPGGYVLSEFSVRNTVEIQ